MKTLYTAIVTATGGREGHIKSDNGVLDLQIRFPKGLGGKNDDYTNPEQLFAAGYAACFDSALNLIIRTSGTKTGITSVTAKVGVGQTADGGFKMEVELAVNIPGVSEEQALQLTEEAHKICPYSNATRNNINVKLSVSNN